MNRSRIRRLTVEGFRGVAGQLTLDLDADTILISGGNGSGKTVISDAIRWCLSGRLPELERRQEGEAQKLDHIVSAFRSPRDEATVEVELAIDGADVRLRRHGNARSSTLELDHKIVASSSSVFGADDDETLQDALESMAVLGQDVVSKFANGRSDERYMTLRVLLGLSRLSDFEGATQRAVKDLQEHEMNAATQLQKLRARYEVAAMQLEDLQQSVSREGRESLLVEAKAIAEEPLGFSIVLPESIDASVVANLGRELSAVIDQLNVLHPISAELEVALGKPHSDDAVLDAEAELLRLESAHQELTERLPWRRLAEAALPLLDEACPVCEQPIDESATTKRLQRLLSEATAEDEAIAAMEARAREAKGRFDSIRTNRERVAASKAKFALALQDWQASVNDLANIKFRSEQFDSETISGIRAEAERLRGRWRDIYSAVAAPSGQDELRKVELTRDEIGQDVSAARSEHEDLAQRVASAKASATATKKACLEITERELARFTPALRTIFRRLDPHPAFKEIDFRHQFSHSKGRTTAEVNDPRTGVTTNPAIAFSEGQLNATAVALFSALALTVQTPRFPFVLLDDPLQALDGASALGFAELCRELRRFRQLILTTHDKRFAALLARKLAAREKGQRNLHIELIGWRPEGPSFKVHEIPMDEGAQRVVLHAA